MGKRIPIGKPARRTRRTPAPRARSLRIQLNGTRTPLEMHDMLRQAVARIQELGIAQASRINLYITPVDKAGNPVAAMSEGQPLDSFSIAAPYHCAADEYDV